MSSTQRTKVRRMKRRNERRCFLEKKNSWETLCDLWSINLHTAPHQLRPESSIINIKALPRLVYPRHFTFDIWSTSVQYHLMGLRPLSVSGISSSLAGTICHKTWKRWGPVQGWGGSSILAKLHFLLQCLLSMVYERVDDARDSEHTWVTCRPNLVNHK
jgi:hypothetical protein